MNLILSFLQENYEALKLQQFGAPDSFSTVMITPQVHRSSHVEFHIMAKDNPTPVLVAKLPRTPASHVLLQQEYENLQKLQAKLGDYRPHLPTTISYRTYHETPILLQLPIIGQPIGPRTKTELLHHCWQQITTWQIELQQFQQIQRASTRPETARTNWFDRLVERPIRYLTKYFPITEREVRLLVRTWDLVQPLRETPLPLVFSHGNLAKYNVRLIDSQDVGILQWDLAEPYGLPACDLFHLFGTAAISLDIATSRSAYIGAVQRAFFEQERWAQRYMQQYSTALQLAPSVLTALFVMTWLQSMVNTLLRLGHVPITSDPATMSHYEECSTNTAQWLRKRPSFLLWEYAIDHAPSFRW